MIREWRRIAEAPPEDFRWTEEALAEYLVHCHELPAMRAVVDGFARRALDARVEILRALDEPDAEAPYPPMPGATEKRDIELDDEVEKLLVHALTDREMRDGMSIDIAGVTFQNPRVCDLAAALLARRRPDRYSFEPGTSLRRRDRQCIELANTWRRSHGLEPLPVAEHTAPPRLPDRVTHPLMRELLDAPSAAERARVITALESYGLPALAAVSGQLGQLPVDHAARKDLETLAKRLACIVSDITFNRDSLAPDKPLKTLIEAGRARPLAAKHVVDLIRHAALNMPRGANTLEMTWERGAEGAGVGLEIRLAADKPDSRGSSQCDVHQNVSLGDRNIHHSTLLASREGAAERNDYAGLTGAIDQALGASPDTPFVIHIKVQLRIDVEP